MAKKELTLDETTKVTGGADRATCTKRGTSKRDVKYTAQKQDKYTLKRFGSDDR